MAIKLLVATLVYTAREEHPWGKDYRDLKHEVRHDLESFYMMLVSLSISFANDRMHERALATTLCHAFARRSLTSFWLTGQEELNISDVKLRYLASCTDIDSACHLTFLATLLLWHLALSRFGPPFMESPFGPEPLTNRMPIPVPLMMRFEKSSSTLRRPSP